jgi:hypothetical protein
VGEPVLSKRDANMRETMSEAEMTVRDVGKNMDDAEIFDKQGDK